VFRPDHQICGLTALKGLDEEVVFVPLDLHRLAPGGYSNDLLRQHDDADVIESGLNRDNMVRVDCLMNHVLRKGVACANEKKWNYCRLQEHDKSPLFLPEEEDASGAVLFLPGG
jgi:hypothetical protein